MANDLTLLLITSENESLILVLQNNIVFVAGCLLQHHSDVIYIESLDTTGLIFPREVQRDVVFSLISYVCNLDSSIISVFSIPKKETIFGKSELNPSKGFYTPKKLESFWKNHFTNLNLGKVHTYSNLTKEKSFPYKLINQIRMFDDDPKRKTKIDEQEISLFYQSLLHRADFIKGSLIYLEKKEINSFAKECVFEENSVVRRALSFLRNGDFSNLQNGKECTFNFMNMFYFEKIEFDFLKCKIYKEVEEDVIFLNPVKKNNKNI